jgi:hypothetical protein
MAISSAPEHEHRCHLPTFSTSAAATAPIVEKKGNQAPNLGLRVLFPYLHSQAGRSAT